MMVHDTTFNAESPKKPANAKLLQYFRRKANHKRFHKGRELNSSFNCSICCRSWRRDCAAALMSSRTSRSLASDAFIDLTS